MTDQLSRDRESPSSCSSSWLLVTGYTLHTLLSPAQPGAVSSVQCPVSTSQLICLCLHLNTGSVHTVAVTSVMATQLSILILTIFVPDTEHSEVAVFRWVGISH